MAVACEKSGKFCSLPSLRGIFMIGYQLCDLSLSKPVLLLDLAVVPTLLHKHNSLLQGSFQKRIHIKL